MKRLILATALASLTTSVFADDQSFSNTSLVDTMQFIRNRIGAGETINATMIVHDSNTGREGSGPATFYFGAGGGTIADCLMHHNRNEQYNTSPKDDQDNDIPLKTVSDVALRSGDDWYNGRIAKEGRRPELTVRFNPPIFVVEITTLQYGRSLLQHLVFRDEGDATDMAKAIAHAAELCGGFKK